MLLLSILSSVWGVELRTNDAFFADALEVSGLQGGVALENQVLYLEDPKGELSAEAVMYLMGERERWTRSDDTVPNLGFSTSTFWFRVTLRNSSREDMLKLFEVSYPLLSRVVNYRIISGVLIEGLTLGHEVPYSNRVIANRNLIFPITLPANDSVTLLFRVFSDNAVHFPITMWNEREFWQDDQFALGYQGLYFGLMGVMILYNLFIAWGTREKIYLLYVGLILSVMLFQTVLKGVGYQFLWPHSPYWNAQSLAIFVPLANLTAGVFAMEMLHIKEKLPRFYKPLIICFILSFASIVISFVIPYFVSIRLSTALVFVQSGMVTIVCLARSRDGETEALVFTVAWLAFLLGSMVLALNKFALLPYNAVTENAVQVGSAIETILLSLALALRINRLREDSANTKLESQEIQLQARIDVEEGKAKSEFLAMMSHEIRTPMNGVLGLVDVLRRTKLDEKQTQLIQVIQSSGEMLLNIINDILDFSKADVDRLELESIPVDVEAVIDDCTAIYTAIANQQRTLLFSYHDRNIPDAVLCDPTRLKQVLSNLLGNAFKFTESGHVAISSQLIDRLGRSIIRFEIEDTGIGLSDEQKNKLFKPFSQADRSITRKFGGTGLGLAISKKIVESLEGDIGVVSKEGEGSIFWFEIPVDVVPETRIGGDKHLLICTDYFPVVHFCRRAMGDENVTLSLAPIIHDGKRMDLDGVCDGIDIDEVIIFTRNEHVDVGALVGNIRSVLSVDHSISCVVPTQHHELSITEVSGIRFYDLPLQLHKHLQLRERALLELDSDSRAEEGPDIMQSLKVLVAEDNPVNQMVIRGILAPMVDEVVLVNNGLEAVEKMSNSSDYFDVIFMDCEMPEMDGYEATKKIRLMEKQSNKAPIKIVALTAHALAEFRQKAIDSGMDDHLAKPINRKQLTLFFREHYEDEFLSA